MTGQARQLGPPDPSILCEETRPKISPFQKIRFKQLRVGLTLAFISIGLTIGLLEVAAHFLPWPYRADKGRFYVCHDALGWMGKPNFQGVIEDKNFRQAVQFNAAGMHDTDHSFQKAPDTFRILMLGDSFVQAVQVSQAETAHQVLEDYLNETGPAERPEVEVISGGVINWGANQQLVYYRNQGRRFQADLVLLMFYIGNDFMDNLPGNVLTIRGRNCYAPYFAVCENGFKPTPLPYAPGLSRVQNNCSPARRALITTMGRLYQHSRLYQQLEPLLIARRPRQEFGQAYPSPFSALYLPDEETELSQAWRVTQATMARLQQEVERDGARFAVALISPEIVVRLAALSPAEQALFLQDNAQFAAADIAQPTQRLAAFLTAQNTPVIDLTGPMVEHLAANGTPLYIIGDGHWTVEGNRVAGETLGRWLVETGLLAE